MMSSPPPEDNRKTSRGPGPHSSGADTLFHGVPRVRLPWVLPGSRFTGDAVDPQLSVVRQCVTPECVEQRSASHILFAIWAAYALLILIRISPRPRLTSAVVFGVSMILLYASRNGAAFNHRFTPRSRHHCRHRSQRVQVRRTLVAFLFQSGLHRRQLTRHRPHRRTHPISPNSNAASDPIPRLFINPGGTQMVSRNCQPVYNGTGAIAPTPSPGTDRL